MIYEIVKDIKELEPGGVLYNVVFTSEIYQALQTISFQHGVTIDSLIRSIFEHVLFSDLDTE